MKIENEAESEFKKWLVALGGKFSRRGYPDFMVIDSDDNIVGFVEVKRYGSKKLKKEQARFERFCAKRGIPFTKWSPDSGKALKTAFWEKYRV